MVVDVQLSGHRLPPPPPVSEAFTFS
jgi:hypothetical protein